MAAAVGAETASEQEKWENSDSEQDSQDEEQEEEEEALSLCDLPVNLIEENESSKEEIEADNQENEDFNFRSWDETNISTRSEMCAADDIFFQGQILPFRLSVSSESNLAINIKSLKQETLNLSRSESLDRVSTGGFTSTFSSRSSSSSSRSQISSNSSTIASNSVQKNSKPTRIQNQFHTHPSPKPQIRNSNISSHSRNRKSNTTWDIFRVGLIRTPEIEFQDLKIRNSVSRNSSSGSSNSNSSSKKSNPRGKKQRKQSLLSGCSCKVTAVKPVAINSKTSKKERLIESKQKRKKQEMSGHRTFEWIKELSSHANFLDHEEGHIES